jgi:uncharacterized protein YkwD
VASLASGGAAYGDAGAPPFSWRSQTKSPEPQARVDARDAPLYAACGASDPALGEVAARNATSKAFGPGLLRPDELSFALRAAGDPHVWPRAWSLSGAGLDESDALQRLKAWAEGWKTLGRRRCGIARTKAPDGTLVVSAVAFDALADIEPLPTTARVGQWLRLEGTMLVPASGVQVILLGPRGAPRTVVSSLSAGRIRSSFAIDQPGGWLVQVLANVSTGPRPVLEAMVFADATPPAHYARSLAPGEDAAKGARDDADAVQRMVNASRATEQLPALPRDAELDRLAREHSIEMQRAGLVGHDVGGGDPRARIEAAGIPTRIAGENVASATSLESAHRALWASPSHRGNLLFDRFKRLGIGVVRDANGVVWVTELFAT